MRGIVVSVALVGLGVGSGYLLGALGAGREPRPSLPTAVVRDERAPVVVGGRGLSEADLRRVVKEELAARPTEDGRVAPQAESSEPPATDPTILDEGMRRVDQALAQRQWTRADAIALGRTLERASPAQRTQILRVLVPAVNRGEIKLTYHGPPF